MTEYLVQAGPLRTFETLFDARSGKTRQVADFHTIDLVSRDRSHKGVLAQIHRSRDREARFISSFLSRVRQDRTVVFGLRDANQGHAWLLGRKLQGQKKLRWSQMKYGLAEDDLVLVEVRDWGDGFGLLREFAPPESGEIFFCVSAVPFDLHDVYWRRAARSSARPGEDRFRRDAAASAHDSRLMLMQDESGSFTVILHPQAGDVEEAERQIAASGREAGLRITFAPGLFG